MNGGTLVGAAKVIVDGRMVGVEQTRHVKLYRGSLAPLFGQTPALEVAHADRYEAVAVLRCRTSRQRRGRRGHAVYGRGE
jgi:hypothetical protein